MEREPEMIDAPPITAKEFFETMVEVPVDDTCRTCRFWERYYYDIFYGLCSNDDEMMPIIRGAIGESAIYYPETFGCRFHRPK